MISLVNRVKNRLNYEKGILKFKIEYRKSILKNLKSANAKNILKIETYDKKKSYQAMHPSIIDFGYKWNGWRYWMGYTPYTFGNENLENPSIAVSNNLILWEKPIKITNPLESTPDSNYYHWSDIHLVYREDMNYIECWYRKRIKKPVNSEQIYRRIIKNGDISKENELLFVSNNTFNQFLSPVILYDYISKRYQIWVVSEKSNKNIVKYFESYDGYEWEFIREIDIAKYDEYDIWHMDIKKTKKGYEMFFCGMNRGIGWIFYTKSKDNIKYDYPIVVIQPQINKKAFDNKSLYRPCFIIKDNKYNVFYSAENRLGEWGIGHSISEEINSTKLKGL